MPLFFVLDLDIAGDLTRSRKTLYKIPGTPGSEIDKIYQKYNFSGQKCFQIAVYMIVRKRVT